jgi:hypothetical protein
VSAAWKARASVRSVRRSGAWRVFSIFQMVVQCRRARFASPRIERPLACRRRRSLSIRGLYESPLTFANRATGGEGGFLTKFLTKRGQKPASSGDAVRRGAESLSAADRKYGDVSPGPRAAPRTPGASSRPARPYTGSAATDRRPPGRRRARPRAWRLGAARGPWISAAGVSVIVFASAATN